MCFDSSQHERAGLGCAGQAGAELAATTGSKACAQAYHYHRANTKRFRSVPAFSAVRRRRKFSRSFSSSLLRKV